MIKPRSKIPTYSEHDDDFYPKSVAEEIAICTSCNLPVSVCNSEHCERYDRMIREIRKKRKLSRAGKLYVKGAKK